MLASLQKRFLILVVLPVAGLLIAGGVGAFFLAKKFWWDEWLETTNERLERAALGISDRLNDKLQLISLIGKAAEIPHGEITQAFLIQQLAQKPGVRFVDVVVEKPSKGLAKGMLTYAEDHPEVEPTGLYSLELCEDVGFCAPVLDPDSLDRSLRIVKVLTPPGQVPVKRLVVRISFDSFLQPLTDMGLPYGSMPMLVTSTGQILAHADKATNNRNRLGDNGDPLEKRVLERMRKDKFGTEWSSGHSPDVVGFYKIPHINWYLVLFAKGREIFRPLVDLRLHYGVAALLSVIVAVFLIRRTTCSVVVSIREITDAAAKVREGDYTVKLREDRADEIGQLNRSFNEMIAGLKERDIIEQTFGRYVDKTVAKELMSRPEALRMGGEKKTVTIMMADLRNFTSISEKLSPEEVIKVLNCHFRKMIEVIERYQGIIVDFYGDSILVFFNGVLDEVEKRAGDAVKCAMEMQRAQQALSRDLSSRHVPELRMGIGIHTGEVIVGNIGTESRAKYGIVGSDVNLTSRIQATASGGKIVISEETFRTLGGRIEVSSDFSVCLKGVGRDRNLYEVASFNGESPAS